MPQRSRLDADGPGALSGDELEGNVAVFFAGVGVALVF